MTNLAAKFKKEMFHLTIHLFLNSVNLLLRKCNNKVLFPDCTASQYCAPALPKCECFCSPCLQLLNYLLLFLRKNGGGHFEFIYNVGQSHDHDLLTRYNFQICRHTVLQNKNRRKKNNKENKHSLCPIF